MSMATFVSQLLLLRFAKHPIKYVFATCSVFFSALTLCGLRRNYVARGKSSQGFYRKKLLYYHRRNDGVEKLHKPTKGEVVRFVYCVLTFLLASIDLYILINRESLHQVLSAFVASFSSVIFVTALIDLLHMYLNS
ncbi:hypothetical protein AAHA92_13703 [Salvia divinorum]|uniref:Uncharacterized protein n=1 Tax=Salvia divinorum TaxID=28513 RepID=A0ABD1HCH3_SALDI